MPKLPLTWVTAEEYEEFVKWYKETHGRWVRVPENKAGLVTTKGYRDFRRENPQWGEPIPEPVVTYGEKPPTPPGQLPTEITIGGNEVAVSWISLGYSYDQFSQWVEYFAPALPWGQLLPSATNDLANNLYIRQPDGIFEIAELEDFSAAQIAPHELFAEVKYQSLVNEMLNRGVDPSILRIPEVSEALLQQSQFVPSGTTSEGFLGGMFRMLQEVSLNPGRAMDILSVLPGAPQPEFQAPAPAPVTPQILPEQFTRGAPVTRETQYLTAQLASLNLETTEGQLASVGINQRLGMLAGGAMVNPAFTPSAEPPVSEALPAAPAGESEYQRLLRESRRPQRKTTI